MAHLNISILLLGSLRIFYEWMQLGQSDYQVPLITYLISIFQFLPYVLIYFISFKLTKKINQMLLLILVLVNVWYLYEVTQITADAQASLFIIGIWLAEYLVVIVSLAAWALHDRKKKASLEKQL